MSFFARASWPGDHRDEIVAGTLVAAVIVVLGYASGIGAPAATPINTAAPPVAGAPSASPGASDGSGASNSRVRNSGISAGGAGSGSAGDSWPGSGDAGIPVVAETPPTSGRSGDGTAGEGGGQEPVPVPSGSASDSPTPIPSPTSPNGCQEGEAHLVQPLLNGVITPVTGLLDGLLDGGASGVTASPSPSASPSQPTSSAAGLSSVCVGVAASPSLLTGVLP
ncbi:hypothetical protein EDD90_6327 [Streptomyces sp. Ag109_O5-1]|nr:hypothetical protein EDD90_6327 [Streptomyces sp. Ag109_O5-1]